MHSAQRLVVVTFIAVIIVVFIVVVILIVIVAFTRAGSTIFWKSRNVAPTNETLLLAERRQWNRRTLLALVVGGVLCIALLSPLLVPMVTALAKTSEADLMPSAAAAKEKKG